MISEHREGYTGHRAKDEIREKGHLETRATDTSPNWLFSL
jgi:hypothetical protein